MDFLLCSTSLTTATRLSSALKHEVSHDKISRFLRHSEFSSKSVWLAAKPYVREMEGSSGVLIIDDSIAEKRYTDESDLVSWHFDHSRGRSVKGVNFVSMVYENRGHVEVVGLEFIKKDCPVFDKKKKKEVRVASISKNDYFRQMLSEAHGKIKFKYVLADTWYASAKNMRFVAEDVNAQFLFAIKENRLVALSKDDKEKGIFVRIESLGLEQGVVLPVFLKSLEVPVQLGKQVFKNGDGSAGDLYLITSDLTLEYAQMTTIYQKRWKVEEFHKKLKSNASFTKSPTKIERTQLNHFYLAAMAVIKMELISMRMSKNHFALKQMIYLEGLKAALQEIRRLST